jgi:DNA repair protein RadA/Sms
MKEKTVFICRECGHGSVRWLGRCPSCGAWNSFDEEVPGHPKGRLTRHGTGAQELADIEPDAEKARIPTGIAEFDRVSGGGIVKGSVTLIAGEPGVGKSTLILSAGAKIASGGKKVLYVCAEESLPQVRLRADRLGVSNVRNFFFLPESEVSAIRVSLDSVRPDFVIVDSIQLIYNAELDYPCGSLFQVRESAYFFIEYAKRNNVGIFLIGHVTKEGNIAGPKLLEHLVDTVFSFEGESLSNLRILRAVKNRFGSTEEIGVFRMEETGLSEVPEASRLFLSRKQSNLPGSVIFPSQEGRRTILVEIQSLVSPSYLGVPRRTFTGLDYHRVNLILAVLEKKMNLNLGTHDVYFNVTGGLRIAEPAADLAIAVATLSSFREKPPLNGTVFIGEVALTGEIRQVQHLVPRLKESARLGFQRAFVPRLPEDLRFHDMELVELGWLQEVSSRVLQGS